MFSCWLCHFICLLFFYLWYYYFEFLYILIIYGYFVKIFLSWQLLLLQYLAHVIIVVFFSQKSGIIVVITVICIYLLVWIMKWIVLEWYIWIAQIIIVEREECKIYYLWRVVICLCLHLKSTSLNLMKFGILSIDKCVVILDLGWGECAKSYCRWY